MRKYFTLLTVLLSSAPMWAQFDDAPELRPATKLVADGKTEYKLRLTVNEDEVFFYGKGNNWGTRASAKLSEDEALTVRFAPTTYKLDSVTYETVRLNNYVADKGGWNAAADCDDNLDSWVDGQGRAGDGAWQVKNLGNGKIELVNLVAGADYKFGLSKSRATWSDDEEDYVVDVSDEVGDFDNRLYFIGSPLKGSLTIYDKETGDSIGTRPAHIWGEENYTTWELMDAATYNARLKLYSWYWGEGEYAENPGCDIDDKEVVAVIEKADAIYKNPEATVEELEAAFAEIIRAVDMIAVRENEDLLSGASADSPVDLYEMGLLQNPTFEENIEGWSASLTGNDNHKQGDTYSNNGVTIKHFAESWTWNAQHSGNGEFSQKIALPEGLYKLEADIIATRQTGSKENSKGVVLFAENLNNNEFFSVDVATANNAPEHFVLSFITKGGGVTFGVRETNPTVNWIAMDNFKMTYYGKDLTKTIEQINLGGVISDIAAKHDGLDEIHAQNTAIEAYDTAFDTANNAYENGGLTDEQYVELSDSLKSKYNQLIASINDYNYFAKCIETAQERVELWQDINEDCAGEIAEYCTELQEAYEAQVWGREEIDQINDHVANIIAKYTDIKPGDDVTFYLNNPRFQQDFSGWNVVGTTPVYAKNHQQGANANAEEDFIQETPEENDGLAECYHALFDMSQTIKNVPAGLYTLSVQGFNRCDDNVNEPAELYATFADGTEQTVPFALIDEYKTENRLYLFTNADGGTEWWSDAGRDGDTYWVPNGMTGAAWHFVNKSDGENYDYTNKFNILMKESGDLKVGVRVKNTHQWVIWDNFELKYVGSGAIVWEEPIQEEINKLNLKVENSDITEGCQNAIDEVISEAETFIEEIAEKSETECQEIIALLKAQYDVINENIALQAEVEALVDPFMTLEEKVQEAEESLKERYDAAYQQLSGDYYSLDNEGLKALIEEAKNIMLLVKLPANYNEASDENPVDVSAVIANRYFNVDGLDNDGEDEFEPAATQNHNFTEWQGKQFGTGGGAAANCGEVWNSDAFDAYQELAGLPAGKYILSCDGFLRHGAGSANSYAVYTGEKDQQVYAYLYGHTSKGDYSTELYNIASVQMDQDSINAVGISGNTSEFGNGYKAADQLNTADSFFKNGYYKNNNVTVEVGEDGILRLGIKKIGKVDQDWVVVDNFSLIYLGGNSNAETSDDPMTPINEVRNDNSQKNIFTITGVRVSKALKPGLYIINGKKVLVK